MEDLAVRAVCGEAVPCSSTKGYTGHTLCACGILEALLALECIEQGFIAGCLGVEQPDPAFGSQVAIGNLDRPVRQDEDVPLTGTLRSTPVDLFARRTLRWVQTRQGAWVLSLGAQHGTLRLRPDDASMGGIKVRIPGFVEVGERCRITIEGRGGSREVVEAVVRWVGEPDEAGFASVGLAFSCDDERVATILTDLLRVASVETSPN